MRVQILSDLHVDVIPRHVPPLAAGAELVIVAGDTCQRARKAFALLRSAVADEIPILTVMGNHEFYGTCYPEELQDARRAADEIGVELLENQVAEIGELRVLGCTLWTDYLLHGPAFRDASMAAARQGLNDHRRITWCKSPWQRFRPFEAAGLHAASRAFLEVELSKPFGGRTIVVSHHAPHPRSLDPRFVESALNPAYASCLDDLIVRYGPDLWIHGHVHCSSDYLIGRTRIVSNPAGYGGENPAFDPALCIDV